MRNDHLTFDEWFDIFKAKVIAMGYYGRLEQTVFLEYYENEMSPHKAAKNFISEEAD